MAKPNGTCREAKPGTGIVRRAGELHRGQKVGTKPWASVRPYIGSTEEPSRLSYRAAPKEQNRRLETKLAGAHQRANPQRGDHAILPEEIHILHILEVMITE